MSISKRLPLNARYLDPSPIAIELEASQSFPGRLALIGTISSRRSYQIPAVSSRQSPRCPRSGSGKLASGRPRLLAFGGKEPAVICNGNHSSHRSRLFSASDRSRLRGEPTRSVMARSTQTRALSRRTKMAATVSFLKSIYSSVIIYADDP
jgi:hypothetical protein